MALPLWNSKTAHATQLCLHPNDGVPLGICGSGHSSNIIGAENTIKYSIWATLIENVVRKRRKSPFLDQKIAPFCCKNANLTNGTYFTRPPPPKPPPPVLCGCFIFLSLVLFVVFHFVHVVNVVYLFWNNKTTHPYKTKTALTQQHCTNTTAATTKTTKQQRTCKTKNNKMIYQEPQLNKKHHLV